MKRNRHLYINGQEVYLDDDETIPLTKQVNNIAELKDRQCDFTQNFKIPATRANRLIFEHANLLSSQTFVPYVKNSCTYVEEGIELISDGYIIMLNFENGYFNCAAYSGNADFFKLIDKLKLSNLNLSDLNMIFDSGIFVNPNTDCKWLIFEPAKEGDGLATQNASIFNFRPFIKNLRIFKQIIQDQGWSLTGDFDKIEGWQICPSLNADLSNYIAEMRINNQMQNYAECIFGNTTITTDNKNSIIVRNTKYIFQLLRAGKYRFTITGRFLMQNATRMVVRGTNGIDIFEVGSNTNNGVIQDFELIYEYNNTLAGSIMQFAAITEGGSSLFYSFGVKLQLIESTVAYNDTIAPASILPDLEQSKFLKSISNMFGLVFSVDSRKKEIFVWQFDRLLKNIPIAKNWSKYLDQTSDVLSYRIGEYAQSNVMKYKELESVPKGYGDGYLFVNNETIDNSKDLFTLDFSACNDILFKNKIIAYIPVCEKSDGQYKNNDSKDARVVLDKFVTGASVTFKSGDQLQVTTTLTEYYAAYFADTSIGKSLAFGYSLIPNNYRLLTQVLNNSKKLDVKMVIPSIEVQNLDHSIPIYIDKYQSYFYINKVTGWQKNKKCSVELIKIA